MKIMIFFQSSFRPDPFTKTFVFRNIMHSAHANTVVCKRVVASFDTSKMKHGTNRRILDT